MIIITKEEILNKLSKENIIKANFYKSKNKAGIKKIKCRKIILKNKEVFQIEEFTEKQTFHKNLEEKVFLIELQNLFDSFKQIEIITEKKEFIFLQNKKGKFSFKEKENQKKDISSEFEHNKEKNYIIPIKNIPSFFKDLKIFTQDGKLIKTKSHKFKQINKYLEFIETILPELKILSKTKEKLQIVDFGCGKAYLSFALYYYLTEIKKIPCEIYGLDLKEEVIEFCNEISKKANFENLKFIKGDINNFEFSFQPDMIISLHACDIATDMALAKAIKIKTPIIFAVPCCQHEVNKQIRKNINKINSPMKSLCESGIIREKFSSLLTDTLRAKILEDNNYKVNIEEFIDMDHTPKNILIKAIKINEERNLKNKNLIEKEIKKMKEEFSIKLSLEKFLEE